MASLGRTVSSSSDICKEALRHAKYEIKTTAIPGNLKLAEDIPSLVEHAWKIPPLHNVRKEAQLISRYADLEAQEQRARRAASLTVDAAATTGKALPTPTSKGLNRTKGFNEDPVSGTSSEPNHRVERKGSLTRSSPAALPEQSAEVMLQARTTALQGMMSQTGQNQTTCHFYLESVDWDLGKAVDMYTSMTS